MEHASKIVFRPGEAVPGVVHSNAIVRNRAVLSDPNLPIGALSSSAHAS